MSFSSQRLIWCLFSCLPIDFPPFLILFYLSHEQTASNGSLSVFSTQILQLQYKFSAKISHGFNALPCGNSLFCHTKPHQHIFNSTCFEIPERHCRSGFKAWCEIKRTKAFSCLKIFNLIFVLISVFDTFNRNSSFPKEKAGQCKTPGNSVFYIRSIPLCISLSTACSRLKSEISFFRYSSTFRYAIPFSASKLSPL